MFNTFFLAKYIQNTHTHIELKKNLGSCRLFRPRSGKDEVEMRSFVNHLNYADVQHFVAFLSLGRSGHSWIGSVLDAAPNALVANEYGIFERFKTEGRKMTRDSLFEGIAKNSFLCGKYGRIQVYDYSIPGLWQGKLGDSHTIQVIGDKRGGSLVQRLMSFGKPWADQSAAEAQRRYMQEFRDLVIVPLRFVMVLRNPFNMIATWHLRHGQGLKEIDKVVLQEALDQYLQIKWAAENLLEPNEVYVTTMESFAKHTETELRSICEFSHVQCPPNMVQMVNNLTNHTPHDTYMLVKWEQKQIMVVNNFIAEHLQEYGYSPVLDLTK